MKPILIILSFSIFSLFLSGQQYICQGAISEYSVDIEENNGLGTPGSVYQWQVMESEFAGSISSITPTGNKISIDWGNSPEGTYTLLLSESDNNPCISMQQLEIIIEDPFDFSLSDAYLCSYDDFVTISAPTGYENYEWTNEAGEIIGTSPNIQVSSAGEYFVSVSSGNCVVQKSVEVTEINIPSINISVENNSNLIVQSDVPGISLQYQLQDANQNIIRDWQNSNIFSNIDFGNYWVLVKMEEGNCINKEEVNVFAISNIITPNNDGINDFWDVNGLISQGAQQVNIYDRYGKLLVTLSPEAGMIWNGKYMQRNVPSETYWYLIHFENGKTIRGFITVKDR